MSRPIKLRDLLAQVGLGDFDVGRLGDLEVPAPSGTRPAAPAEHAEIRPHRLAAMGIPQETVRLLEHPERMCDTEAMRAVRELLEEPARCWGVLAGGMGTGKSVAAGWWLSRVRCSRGEGALYVASEDVASIPLGTVHAEERLVRLMGARALVLDDVGVRDSGPDGKLHPTVQRVMSRRYEHRLDMLNTTNLGPPQWRAYLGEARLVDRWDEIGTYKVTADASLRRRTA